MMVNDDSWTLATDDGQRTCGLSLLEGGVTEMDFIGSAVLSTTLFPQKGEVSDHKGIVDELRGKGTRTNATLGICLFRVWCGRKQEQGLTLRRKSLIKKGRKVLVTPSSPEMGASSAN